MHYILRLVIMLVGMWMFTGCCWTDHSEEIKKIAEPMAKELESFYREHKRFPTEQEKVLMLEKVGCDMDKNVCRYKNNKILIRNSDTDYEYMLSFYIDNTYCTFWLNKDGNITELWCQNKPCVELGQ